MNSIACSFVQTLLGSLISGFSSHWILLNDSIEMNLFDWVRITQHHFVNCFRHKIKMLHSKWVNVHSGHVTLSKKNTQWQQPFEVKFLTWAHCFSFVYIQFETCYFYWYYCVRLFLVCRFMFKTFAALYPVCFCHAIVISHFSDTLFHISFFFELGFRSTLFSQAICSIHVFFFFSRMLWKLISSFVHILS